MQVKALEQADKQQKEKEQDNLAQLTRKHQEEVHFSLSRFCLVPKIFNFNI